MRCDARIGGAASYLNRRNAEKCEKTAKFDKKDGKMRRSDGQPNRFETGTIPGVPRGTIPDVPRGTPVKY